jgi:hypothetical protein
MADCIGILPSRSTPLRTRGQGFESLRAHFFIEKSSSAARATRSETCGMRRLKCAAPIVRGPVGMKHPGNAEKRVKSSNRQVSLRLVRSANERYAPPRPSLFIVKAFGNIPGRDMSRITWMSRARPPADLRPSTLRSRQPCGRLVPARLQCTVPPRSAIAFRFRSERRLAAIHR